VTNLHHKNVSLLYKWIWRLEYHYGLWQDLVRAKYLKKGCLLNVNEALPTCIFLSGLVCIKDVFIS
jgi:hypothetical protein